MSIVLVSSVASCIALLVAKDQISDIFQFCGRFMREVTSGGKTVYEAWRSAADRYECCWRSRKTLPPAIPLSERLQAGVCVKTCYPVVRGFSGNGDHGALAGVTWKEDGRQVTIQYRDVIRSRTPEEVLAFNNGPLYVDTYKAYEGEVDGQEGVLLVREKAEISYSQQECMTNEYAKNAYEVFIPQKRWEIAQQNSLSVEDCANDRLWSLHAPEVVRNPRKTGHSVIFTKWHQA